MSKFLRRALWPVMFVALATALVVGTVDGRDTRTAAERTDDIAAEVRCPTCSGLSVAESQSPLAQSLYQEISQRVDQGQSDNEIRAYVVSRYGTSALLVPERKGLGMLVWLLPVVGGVVAVIGIVWAVRKWRSGDGVAVDGIVSESDRQLVAAAMRDQS